MEEVINPAKESCERHLAKLMDGSWADEDVCISRTKEAKMRRIRRFSAALFIFLALLVLTTSATLLTAAAQDPEAGQALWTENNCKNCHGESGEGGWCFPLAGSASTADAWIAQVRSPRNRMPAYTADQISDQTISDIRAYLASLEPPTDFALSEANLAADAPAGQQLIVEKKCVACHSTAGPVQGFMAREETPTAAAVVAQLRTPRNNMPMFRADQVSDEEAATITAFLVSQVSPPSLPETGSLGSSVWLVALVIFGAGLVLSGFALRSLISRR
jgi:mono/diheme cytochrome c family protein